MKKQLKALFIIATFVALLLLAVGCASTSTPTPSTPSLVGTWATTITQEEVPTFAGYVEITFTDNGRVSVFNPGTRTPMDVGSYTVTRDQLFFTDERSECLKLGFPTATYRWSVDNDALTLTAIDDGCYSRHKPLERMWSRKKTVGTPIPPMPALK